jgi:hypothetical protein
LIVCITQEDLEFLKGELKSLGVEVPKFFEKNILLLNPKDFNVSKSQEAVEVLQKCLPNFSNSDII